MTRVPFLPLAGLLALTAGTAHAQLAPQYRALLDKTIESGSDAEIDTVAKFLKKTDPAGAGEVEAAVDAHRARTAEAQKERLAQMAMFQGWKGEGQFGASQSSGNAETVGLSAGLALKREGLHWRLGLRSQVDYQRTNGQTSRNQLLLAFEPDYRFNDRLFLFGLTQYERDRFAGFSARTAVSGGIGYRLIADSGFTVDVKAGPAWRKTHYISQPLESVVTGLGAVNAKWKLSRAVSLTEDASALTGAQNTNVTSLTSLSARLNGALSARTSYQVTYNSNPPDTYKTLDTITRFTLVYGF